MTEYMFKLEENDNIDIEKYDSLLRDVEVVLRKEMKKVNDILTLPNKPVLFVNDEDGTIELYIRTNRDKDYSNVFKILESFNDIDIHASCMNGVNLITFERFENDEEKIYLIGAAFRLVYVLLRADIIENNITTYHLGI